MDTGVDTPLGEVFFELTKDSEDNGTPLEEQKVIKAYMKPVIDDKCRAGHKMKEEKSPLEEDIVCFIC